MTASRDEDGTCPICHKGEIGWDTDANVGRGGLCCSYCAAEFDDTDEGLVVVW